MSLPFPVYLPFAFVFSCIFLNFDCFSIMFRYLVHLSPPPFFFRFFFRFFCGFLFTRIVRVLGLANVLLHLPCFCAHQNSTGQPLRATACRRASTASTDSTAQSTLRKATKHALRAAQSATPRSNQAGRVTARASMLHVICRQASTAPCSQNKRT